MRVDELMSSPATTVEPGLPISEAGRLLLGHGVTAVCVVDAAGHLVGVVSRSDLLRHRLVRDPRAHLRPVSQDDTEPPHTVAEVMTKDVLALPPSADEADAAEMMLERRVRSLPVVEDGRVVGVVSTTDLLRAAVRGDERVAADVRARVEDATGQQGTWQLHVVDGVVTITGASSPAERDTLRRLAETVPGVVRVRHADGEAAPTEPGSRRAAAPGGPRDHRGLVVLTLDDCLARLRAAAVGRVAFVQNGGPVVLPVNHGVDGVTIVFRTTWGSKLEAARSAEVAAFEADDIDPVTRTGWSVLVRGSVSAVYDAHDIERYEALGVTAWAGIDHDPVWVVLRPDEISGREITGHEITAP
jgi:CBS domain-containing protein/nitroimidazol reductase NimA-like FMN-containing flavoprotein (pyridoxamine 5'-phosphate oxidase superfamily)